MLECAEGTRSLESVVLFAALELQKRQQRQEEVTVVRLGSDGRCAALLVCW